MDEILVGLQMKAIEKTFPVVQFKCIMLHKAVLNYESVN